MNIDDLMNKPVRLLTLEEIDFLFRHTCMVFPGRNGDITMGEQVNYSHYQDVGCRRCGSRDWHLFKGLCARCVGRRK